MTITISAADLSALNAGHSVTIQSAAAPPPPLPPTTPASDLYVIYSNGKYNWPGDYNSNATSEYNHVGDAQSPHTSCLKLTVTAPWGEWLPYSSAHGPYLDVSTACAGKPATRLQFRLKATQANQVVSLYCIGAGDVPPPPGVPGYVSLAGVFPVGVWVTQTVLLAQCGVGPGLFSGDLLYKFGVQDKTGRASNILYIDDVMLLP